MYKKSPVRSPLRDVLKSRCQERMRVNRDKVVSGMRDIKMEGSELVESTIREMVRVCRGLSYSCHDCIIVCRTR